MPSCVIGKRCLLFALMIPLWMQWPGSAGEANIPLDALTSVLRYNESSVLSYQGRVRQNEFRVVETNSEGKYIKPLADPLLVRTTDTEFVHDMTRGEDYLVTMRHHSDLFNMELPVTRERRNGSYLETLGQTDAHEPRLGIISSLKDSYYLGHSPRNFDATSHVYILTSDVEQGFYRLPVSQLMARSEYVWPCGTEDVEGYRCVKYAVQTEAPSGKNAYMAYLWLGQDLNFSIVKQETMVMPLEAMKPFSEVAAYGDITKQLEKYQWSGKPAMLIVNKKYVKTESGIWVPETTTSYAMSSLNPSRLLNPDDRDTLLAANLRDPHTKGLLDCVVTGFHVWDLDMNSLKLNEPIDPNVFEKSIIPEGVPVSNFRLGIHPRDLARIAQQNLETVAQQSIEGVAQQALDPNAISERMGGRQVSQPNTQPTSGTQHGGVWVPVLLAVSALLTVGILLARKARRGHAHSAKDS